MKGNKKILIAAILLLLIAVSYGTYAIYRESVAAEATIDAAAWSVKIGSSDFSEANLDFTLADLTCTTNPSKVSGKIAPGAECYKDITVNADGSQVDVVIEVDRDGSTIPSGLEASVGTSGSVTIPYSATTGGMQQTVRLNVNWPGTLDDDSGKDSGDLALAGTSMDFSIKLVARQSLS